MQKLLTAVVLLARVWLRAGRRHRNLSLTPSLPRKWAPTSMACGATCW